MARPNASPAFASAGTTISGQPQINVHAAALATSSHNARPGAPVRDVTACTVAVIGEAANLRASPPPVNPQIYAPAALDNTYVQFARAAAARHSLDPALVCAIVEQESAWNPWAIRYEPVFFAKYVAPLFAVAKVEPATNTEAYSRAMSWGLMQVMGQSARERGFSATFLSELCDPATGLEAGCELLAHKLAIAAGNVAHALALWNGGSNADYAAQVLARLPSYS